MPAAALRKLPRPRTLQRQLGLGLTVMAAHAVAAPADAPAAAPVPASETRTGKDDVTATRVLPAVAVSGRADTSWRARTASVTGRDDASILNTPASVTVVTAAQIADQQAKTVADVLRNDASVNADYTPVGYYGNFTIRGFPLDPASALRLDGLALSGEQNVPLENKARVEILKGLAAIDSGVLSPGGVVNFVSKRPENVSSVTAGVDSRGSTSASVDLGRRFGPDNQFGFRINAAKENIHSYVDDANGRRTFGSIAADWNITPRASLQVNAEFQQWIQRSVSGYQLLGGTVVPPAASTSKLLGVQPWAKPVTTDALNLNARFDYAFDNDWRAYVTGGRSRTMIDDNVAFAYGCGYSPSCGAGGTSPFFFASNGDFDVYDYRSPGEYRRNDEVRAAVSGKFTTGPLRHDVLFGVGALHRVVRLSDAVYDYVGTDNIYGPDQAFAPSPNEASVSYPQLDAWQVSLFASDKISLGDHWQVLLGGRQVLLRQRAWTSQDGDTARTDRTKFLPQLALVYKPVTPLTFYGSYSKDLSLGDQAPVRASNAYAFLPPIESNAYEVGAKYDWANRLTLTAAAFTISRPFQFAQPDSSDAGYTFVQQGRERHDGIELGASGQVTERLALNASLTAIRARAYDSGSPAYEGHQVINTPPLRATLNADYAVPGLPGFHLLGGLEYSAGRTANEEGTARVPGWIVVNAGARYSTKLGGHRITARLWVDNLFNRYYWRDAGEQQGDAYLFLGAPRTARMSVTYDF
ncbi:TonB-dependent siderophore receptor [Burkholderia sp. 22PA0106]|uniref:TonB-dependent siderophore receptor n=1 Tax=Burkholderia sp. 22PA0106 TaxID=3237371 RepID=UPI0039C3F81F